MNCSLRCSVDVAFGARGDFYVLLVLLSISSIPLNLRHLSHGRLAKCCSGAMDDEAAW
jgi:hypothetical protein